MSPHSYDPVIFSERTGYIYVWVFFCLFVVVLQTQNNQVVKMIVIRADEKKTIENLKRGIMKYVFIIWPQL